MSSTLLFLHQLRALTREELRELFFRKRTLLSLFLYLAFFALFLRGISEIHQTTQDFLHSGQRKALLLRQILDYLEISVTTKLIDQILAWPPSFLIIQLICILWFPTLIMLLSCDMVTTDINRGTLRFVMIRSSRLAYYLSKMLAHLTFYAIVYLLTLAVLFIYSIVQFSSYDWLHYGEPTLLYFLVFLLFLWYLVAGTQLVSSLIKRPFVALIGVHLFWFLLLLILIKYPSASPFQLPALVGILLPFEGYGGGSMTTGALWGLGFTTVGFLIFYRRNL